MERWDEIREETITVDNEVGDEPVGDSSFGLIFGLLILIGAAAVWLARHTT